MIVIDKRDLPQILELQKKAFYVEAVKHNDLQMQPMIQTLEEIEKEFNSGTIFFKLSLDEEIVGSVRAKMGDKTTCFVGKLVVNPNTQNKGIGTKLMHELEGHFKDKCSKFILFTGEKSEHALGLYTKLGYHPTGNQNVGEYSLIHMEKDNNCA